jgi:protein-tyrosine phosphatase
VQTDGDMDHRGVNWTLMLERYKKAGIHPVHFPIHDFNENDLTSKLFDAACKIHDMVDKQGLNVYIHCTAGMGRAPASLLVYLCLFKKVKCWQNPTEVDLLVKSFRKVSVPNMKAVYKIV